MKIIMVRHGETLFNALGLSQGWCDSPLTKKGREQAGRLAEALRGYQIDEAYSSTSDRAYETGEIVLGDRNLEIRRDKRLREMNFGVFEGTPNTLRPMVVPSLNLRRTDRTPADLLTAGEGYAQYEGEDGKDVLERELSFLADHVREDDSTILIAGHGLSLSGLVHYLAEDSLKERFPDFFMLRNASAAVLEYRNGTYSVIDIVDVNGVGKRII